MARKRMIDPSFWVDEKLGTADPLARLLFMGLISQADDAGRLNGHPALIRSLIYPYDGNITIQDVEGWLDQLAAEDRKLIVRYEVDHQKYIAIPNFKKHQTINKPQPSKLPEPLPEDYGSDTVVVNDDSLLKEGKVIEEKGKEGKLKEAEEPADAADPYIQVINAFCDLHDKLDVHLKFNEREDAQSLLSMGISAEFIITIMQKVHADRTKKGDNIKSFSYYTGIIKDVWLQKSVPSISDRRRSGQRPKLPVHRPTQPAAPLTPEEEAEFDRLLVELESTGTEGV